MELTVFAKKRNTKEGKIFYTYLTKMIKKDGTEITSQVKFREECGQPKADQCPCNIIVDKKNCNFSTKSVVDSETGEMRTNNTLWINTWEMSDNKYVDHSMDEFI